jgi:hypothetical protein
MKRLLAIALLASAAAHAQTPAELDELYAAQAALRQAQAAFDAKREVVIRAEAAAVAAFNGYLKPPDDRIVALEQTQSSIVVRFDAIDARDTSCRAATQTALDAATKATTILGLRSALLPFLKQCAQP